MESFVLDFHFLINNVYIVS